jgi:hypothetical protein
VSAKTFTDFPTRLASNVTTLTTNTVIRLEVNVETKYKHGQRFRPSRELRHALASGNVERLVLPGVKQIKLGTTFHETECSDMERLEFDKFNFEKDADLHCECHARHIICYTHKGQAEARRYRRGTCPYTRFFVYSLSVKAHRARSKTLLGSMNPIIDASFEMGTHRQ